MKLKVAILIPLKAILLKKILKILKAKKDLRNGVKFLIPLAKIHKKVSIYHRISNKVPKVSNSRNNNNSKCPKK